jgi:two-component system, NtrC family, sensor kinase
LETNQQSKEPGRIWLRIGIIGGGEMCRDMLTRAFRHYKSRLVHGKYVAVADPDADAVGMVYAREKGLFTTADYRDYFDGDKGLGVNQIFIFTPDEGVLDDVLARRPSTTRVLAYNTAQLIRDTYQVEENRYKAQRDQLETIINGILEGIVVIDRDHNVVQVNTPYLDQSGLLAQEVVGRKCYEVFHHSEKPCQPPDHPCPIDEILKTGEPHHEIHTHYNLEGEARIVDLTLYPLRNPEGEVTRFIEICRDITERHRSQERMTQELEQAVAERTQQIEEAHRKLLQQDKMSSLGKLSASVVHELNNPLTGVLNFIRLQRRMLTEREPSQEMCTTILGQLGLMENETARCSKIVSNLLAFARQSKLEPAEAKLNEILDLITELNAHHLALNKIQLIRDFQEDLPPVLGDVSRLEQVFMNILLNAVDEMGPEANGRLLLSTQYDEASDVLLTRITDTGPGIPADNVPHIFEPFFTTKSEGKGVGLGLSVVYGIVKEHNGQVEVEQTGPEGTTFLVTLPVYRA